MPRYRVVGSATTYVRPDGLVRILPPGSVIEGELEPLPVDEQCSPTHCVCIARGASVSCTLAIDALDLPEPGRGGRG